MDAVFVSAKFFKIEMTLEKISLENSFEMVVESIQMQVEPQFSFAWSGVVNSRLGQ